MGGRSILREINLVLDSGTDVKTAQSLARHATPEMTMGTYARVWEDARAKTVEKVGESLLSEEKYAQFMHGMRATGTYDVAPQGVTMVEAGGIEPPSRDGSAKASTHIVNLFCLALVRSE